MRIVYSLWFIVYRIFCLSFILYFLFSIFSAPEVIAATSLEELLASPEKYDGKEVSYQGEVIGDIMIRQESAWLNVLDKSGAIGVFCPKKELVSVITHQGSYQSSGDIISLRGIFHYNCPQHGSDTDIHAENITLIQEGKAIAHPLEPQKVKASIVLSAIAFVLSIVYLVVRRFKLK